ncbi:transferase [Chroococcidiopsis sp. FACHB-1243]|uniref:transferase n=1 Tax=Chroococcidiopsis sp. [FACHB-1243] TaxID=2692781 RepID=UPI001781DCE0|nr:transferase [Chroococcidiopsis sp. [FACHB-1243]]MBD2305008.1 transferase [Chroococcidiopsis sp. [FACHB-1243]]
MSLSPLHPIGNFNSHISGEVIIDRTAAIAPGVVFHADPNSKIIIAAGVCIGMGVVLHAHDGNVEIETGVNLGAGVLVVGKATIGANACVGAATTVFNCSVAPKQVIPPGSLLGDTSRHLTVDSTVEVEAALTLPTDATQASPPTSATVGATPESNGQMAGSAQSQPEPTQPSGDRIVYGKASITRLMATLFPHSQSLNQPPPDTPPSQGT